MLQCRRVGGCGIFRIGIGGESRACISGAVVDDPVVLVTFPERHGDIHQFADQFLLLGQKIRL